MYEELLYITLNENEIIYYISQPPHSSFGSNHVPSKGWILDPSHYAIGHLRSQFFTSAEETRQPAFSTGEGRGGYRFTVMKKVREHPRSLLEKVVYENFMWFVYESRIPVLR